MVFTNICNAIDERSSARGRHACNVEERKRKLARGSRCKLGPADSGSSARVRGTVTGG